jgi:glycosyltransferase involved in cell wall biosynthesis
VRDALVMALARAAQKPDILLSQFALPYGWPVREAAKSFDLPYVIHLRGDDVWIWPHLSMTHMDQFRVAVRDAALVLGVSRAIIDEGVRLVGGDLAATAVVPNGIDLERFRPADTDARRILRAKLGITRSELALLCVAPALAAKGWTELLDAIGQLPDDFAPLVLVGAISRLRVELDLHAEAARRAPRVRLVLRQNAVAEEMVELYQAADVFVLASRSEGMSNAVLEAMATALPVVTTNVGGHAEVIDHGVNGMLAAAGDTAGFRDCLAAMLVSAEARCAIGAAARLRAERIGSSRQAGRRLAAIFERVRRRDSLVDLAAENPYGAGSGASELASSAGVD